MAEINAPSVVVYKDLSLIDAETEYNSVAVNFNDGQVSAYYVDEEQALAAGTVVVDNQTYHKHLFSIRVTENDTSGTPCQDAQRGDVVTVTVTARGLTNKKCELLAKQMIVSGTPNRVEYTMQLAWYELFTV